MEGETVNTHIIVGDSRVVLASLPDKHFDTLITSPPYFGLRHYGGGGAEIGREETEEEYIAAIGDLFAAARRVLKLQGTAWLNIGDSFDAHTGLRLIPHRVAASLRQDGWFVQCDVVWRKTRYMPNGGKSRPLLMHEYVFMLTQERSGHYYNADAIREPHSPVSLKRWASSPVAALGASNAMGHKQAEGGYRTKTVVPNPLGKLKPSVWDICPSNYKGSHFAVMPEQLVEMCIKAGCPPGGRVLDPFAGSGTTGVVAQRLGREFVGVELNGEFAALARQRISEATAA